MGDILIRESCQECGAEAEGFYVDASWVEEDEPIPCGVCGSDWIKVEIIDPEEDAR